MSEQQQQQPLKPAKLASVARRVVEGQQPSDDPLQDVERALGRVTVSYGAYESGFDLAGKSVAYIRENLSHVWNIPADALAVIDGQPITVMENEQKVRANARIEFIKDDGEKG